MARSGAERQAAKRERDALGLLECVAWVPGELLERLIAAGLLSDEASHDKHKRGEIVGVIFRAWVESNGVTHNGVSLCHSQALTFGEPAQ